jgi:alkylation response protein AidB-like acyl-CoA dehydrogenase
MDFSFPETHVEYRDEVRAFARGTVAPVIAALDREGRFPREHVAPMAEHGLFAMHWPRQYGGRGLDTLAYAVACEELAAVSPAHAFVVSVTATLVGVPLLAFGSDEQKSAWLPRIAGGEFPAAFALTEAGAGSDAGALRTTARRDGGDYVLDGEKVWVTNGGEAGLFVVAATVDPARGARGVTTFLVPGDAPGLVRGPRDRLLGLHAGDVRPIRLDGVRVPVAHRLGEEGQGMKVALTALAVGRIGVAGLATGIAAETTALAVEFARTRHQFGVAVGTLGGVAEMLADMAVERDVAQLFTYEAAQARDRGEDFAALAARAKWTASEAAVQNADRCIQVHGGRGYDEAAGIARYYRDARATRLTEGTSEIQKLLIARAMVAA